MTPRTQMVHRTLSTERLRVLLTYSPDTGHFTWRVAPNGRVPANSRAGTLHANGRRYIKVDGVKHLEHRLAWFYTHGRWPSDQLDHANGVPDDNRLENLRECTRAENGQNRKLNTNNSTGHQGVSWRARNRKWGASIRTNGRQEFLGLFTSAEEAGEAYRSAKARLHTFQPAVRNETELNTAL